MLEDALFHNLYDPQRPQELLYEYEQLFAALSAVVAGAKEDEDGVSSLTLGAGGCIFPQYLERRFPGGRHVAVEIDPRVLEVARRYFDLSTDSRLELIAADARNFVKQAEGRERFDLITLDAFNSFSIPYHLTTVEFVEMLVRMLEPQGIVLANCIDIFAVGRFLNAYRNTLQRAFPHVAVCVDKEFDPEQRMTFVIAASFRPLPFDLLVDETGRTVGSRLPETRLAELHSRCGAGFLSDGYASVDNLLAPVFLRGGSD